MLLAQVCVHFPQMQVWNLPCISLTLSLMTL